MNYYLQNIFKNNYCSHKINEKIVKSSEKLNIFKNTLKGNSNNFKSKNNFHKHFI